MVEDGASLTQEPGPAAEEGRPTSPTVSAPLQSTWAPLPSQFFFKPSILFMSVFNFGGTGSSLLRGRSSSCSSWGLFFTEGRGLLIAVPSLFQSTGSRAHGLQELQSVGSIDAVPRF